MALPFRPLKLSPAIMTPPRLFDNGKRRQQRDRAAAGYGHVDFLKRAMSEAIAERVADINRRFERALDLGCHRGWIGTPVAHQMIGCDISGKMLARHEGAVVQALEDVLPFADASFDLIVSAGSLHMVNDLPGCLMQCRSMLKPDGFFIAAFPGDETLADFRACLLEAESETGGAAQRIIPMIDVRSAGALLQRAGFAMPVAEAEHLTVTYSDPLAMLAELHAMGEGNALTQRQPLARTALLRACELHAQRHRQADGRIAFRFSIVIMAGWAPAAGQPRPLPRGSGKVSLASVLGKP